MIQKARPPEIGQVGRLRFFQRGEAIVSARWPGGNRRLLHLRYARDGSLFVQFPYFHNTQGVLAELHFGTGEKLFPRNIDFADGGVTTSHLVKFAHHLDGEAHFSQDGRVRTTIRRKSFRLDGPNGHLFQFSAHGLEAFEQLSPKALRKAGPSIEFTFDTQPPGVSVVGDWCRTATLERIVGPDSAPPGPLVELVDPIGRTHELVLLSPPGNAPAPSHLLVLGCEAESHLPGTTEPFLLFIGGWDPHEVSGTGESIEHTGALAAMYPAQSVEDLRSKLPSIDLAP